MSNPGKVSFDRVSKLFEETIEVPEQIVQRVIVITFVVFWAVIFVTTDWKYMALGLIPTFLTFNSRKRSTIILVGVGSIIATVVNIFFVHPRAYYGQEDALAFAITFFITLLISICYFANRQTRILSNEQRKRARRDAELRELENAYAAMERSQRALQRLTSLLAENAPVAIAQLTPELRYVMVNPIYLNLIRSQTGEASLALVGKKLTDHLWKTDSQTQEALSLIQHGLPVKLPAQPSVAQTSGKVSYWDWTLWPVKDESGMTESVLLLGAEVTERIHAEQKLEAARFDLEKSNHAKDLFLATLSHELRTPLTPILGWARIMQDYNSDGTVTAQGLQAIERNARLQAQLVDDLLDLSRITMGKIELACAPVDLNEIVRRALETVQYRIEAQKLDLRLHLTTESLLVHADATRLEQVVWNLLTNAVKFTAVGGQVTVRTQLIGNECQVVVSDTGIGIEPDVFPLLFEPFKQGDSSITRRHGGLGIGLAIAQSLVQMHGGKIMAHSAGAGQGARFTVTLPRYQMVSVGLLEPSDAGRALRLDGVKVLVIEDAVDTRELLSIVLQSYGCQVALAETVSQACELAVAQKPEIIISDIGLPEADGYELARRLRQMPEFEHVPMIALTGYAMDTDRQKAYESGFNRHLPKPIDPDVLVRAVYELHLRESIGPLFRSWSPVE
ncbi:MAG TPA: ATP-binding protein [Blastocatellia bacterium]|nr:ATP-binding protein [Blastocatellia bacterium]